MSSGLPWLPKPRDFEADLRALRRAPTPGALQALANHDLDLSETSRLDKTLREAPLAGAPGLSALRLALLSTSTVDHLLPALRVAALRRGLLLELYVGPYDQLHQELMNPASGLHAFRPEAVFFAVDARRAVPELPASASSADAEAEAARRAAEWAGLWERAKALGALVIHQNAVVPPLRLLGHRDALTPGSGPQAALRLNAAVAARAAEAGILVLDLDSLASAVGKAAWCQARLWHHAKQEVSPLHAALYGDHLARVLAAARGLSRKCLVLDLDNTLWGGVIGDDGLEGIELGQGTGAGEAFSDFQRYVRSLRARGIILAACSKNDEKAARLPFERHPETVLKLDDFAVFLANWEDKAANMRAIAARLNIGLDALVFFDDNPAERARVRQALPQVAVPEVPEDPAGYAQLLSDAGWFEAVALTAEDSARAEQYAADAKRQGLMGEQQDLDGFLKGLGMEMTVSPFDPEGLARVAQLINKSNQFNLTTRRYTEVQVGEMMADPALATFQVRLKDAYGDLGMISVVILRPAARQGGFLIDTWLMSCRVLGRQVEAEVLNAVAARAKAMGGRFLVGEYLPTAKNALVREHYAKLGFTAADAGLWELDLTAYRPRPTHIRLAAP